MSALTREELLEEIQKKNDEIKKLKDDMKQLEKLKELDKCTLEIKALYDGFVRVGFTEEQSFEFVKISLSKNV